MNEYSSLESLRRNRFTDVADIVATVRQHGIIIFPGLIAKETISGLSEEFNEILERRKQLNFQCDESPHLINVRLRHAELGAAMFPRTADFFSQPFMERAAKKYVPNRRGDVNQLIFVNKTMTTPPVLPKPPFALHFDRARAFKFFVYLTDVTAAHGPMWIAPGTMSANTAKRKAESTADEENIVPEKEFPSFPIEGPAGTLFVFDSEASHKAGSVQADLERRIMRSHTYFEMQRSRPMAMLRAFLGRA